MSLKNLSDQQLDEQHQTLIEKGKRLARKRAGDATLQRARNTIDFNAVTREKTLRNVLNRMRDNDEPLIKTFSETRSTSYSLGDGTSVSTAVAIELIDGARVVPDSNDLIGDAMAWRLP